MNDDLMFDYLVSMGQMSPQEAELKKKQEAAKTAAATTAPVPYFPGSGLPGELKANTYAQFGSMYQGGSPASSAAAAG